jgi:hypothetical protein
MNVVMIIPTGIGCEIGGHAGDATPAAKLLGACCNKLILHPNVVNASDVNEMPENALYVEGSILDRFLEGDVQLKEVRSNRILLVCNKPIRPEVINAASTARATTGIDVKVLGLDRPLEMIAKFDSKGRATGEVRGWEELCKQVYPYEFDALAISSPISCAEDVQLNYFRNGGVNPWGGVEAKASELIANRLSMPVAHAPTWNEVLSKELKEFNEVVDPRFAAEVISYAFLHCVLKGLHKAPRLGEGLNNKDVDYLITPMGCVGRPHQACMEARIPIIAIRENQSALNDKMPDDWIYLDTYMEAAGFLMAQKIGITIESISRPLESTVILK